MAKRNSKTAAQQCRFYEVDNIFEYMVETYMKPFDNQSKENLMNKTTEKIPTWSLGYIINGDMTGLTDEEIRMIDEWLSKWKVQIVSPLTDEEGNTQPYFSRYPLFGLPAEVEDCDILYTNDNI